MRSRAVPALVAVTVGVVLWCVGSYLGQFTRQSTTGYSAIFIPVGVAVAVMALHPRFAWAIACGMVLGGQITAVVGTQPHGEAAADTLVNAAESAFIAFALLRARAMRFERPRDVVALAVWGVVGTALAATAGTLLLHRDLADGLVPAWAGWFSADLVSIILLVPMICAVRQRPTRDDLLVAGAFLVLTTSLAWAAVQLTQHDAGFLSFVCWYGLLLAITAAGVLRGVFVLGVAQIPALVVVFTDATQVTQQAWLNLQGAMSIIALTLLWVVLTVRQSLAKRERTNALREMAQIDPVTGVLSRSASRDAIDEACGAGSTAVVFVDIAEFLTLGRGLGIETTDRIMRELAARLKAVIGPQAQLGRFDSDRFVVIVPNGQEEQLRALADAVLHAMCAEIRLDGIRIARGAVVGAAISVDGGDGDALLHDADAAVLEARVHSGPGFVLAAAGTRRRIDDLHLEHQIREGLDRGEFVAHFQPQVRLADGLVVGHETLARWHHPNLGMVPPATFIPVAEAAGLIDPLSRTLLDQAVSMAVRCSSCGIVAVNVSAISLQHPTWPDVVEEALAEHGLPPERLAIEITESVVLRLSEESRRGLFTLVDLGVELHLDDFGTGYSSLALLRELPVTALKLDRSFVHDIAAGTDNLALVAGLAGLARGLGLKTIAEGIETREQADLLLEVGWDLGQGYLFGAPSAEPLGLVRIPG